MQLVRLFTSVKLIDGVLQLSVPVAVPVAAGAVLVLHCMVVLPGQEIPGTVLSTTLTLKVQVLELLLASVAVNVTVVVPTPLNAAPAAGDWVTVTVPQLSVADAPLVAVISTEKCVSSHPASLPIGSMAKSRISPAAIVVEVF